MATKQKKPVDTRALALGALARLVADPTPRPIHGAKGAGIVEGNTEPAKTAAAMLLEHRWIAGTGSLNGPGKKAQELYKITAEGIHQALTGELSTLIREMSDALEKKNEILLSLRAEIDNARSAVEQQTKVVREMQERVTPPSASPPHVEAPGSSHQWLNAAVEYVRDFQRRNPLVNCPLPELFHNVAEPRRLSLGQFHDGLRELIRQQRIRLHPYTGSDYALEEGECGLILGKEIKFYASQI